MSYTRVGAVTGGNKGIGLAIVRQLALQYPKSPLNNGPLLIYLTARDPAKGEQALKDIHADADLKDAKALASEGGPTDVKFHPLDITQTKSIQEFAAHLKEKHPDGIDFLINNAGVALQGFDYNVVKETLECNYYGTLEACQDVLPITKKGGRIVNLASMAGTIRKYSPELQKRLQNAHTVPEVTALMEEFKSFVKEGTHEQHGWTSAAYSASKAGVIGMTAALAREQEKKGSGILINSCCPGWVVTDMTSGRGAKDVDEGAQTPVMLAIHDIGGKQGQFWQHEKIITWEGADATTH